MTTEPPDGSAPAPYVARYRRVPPVLTMAFGAIALTASAGLVARAVRAETPDRVPPPLALGLASVVVIVLGAARLVRGRRRGWSAFTVDAEAVSFAAWPDGEVRRLPWDEVSALVLFSRRTEFVQGTVRCVGVRLHPTAVGSPERHLAELSAALARPDLQLHAWERLRSLSAGPSEAQLELAVSFHAEERGWRCRPSRLRKAMRAHAPGVPVVTEPSERYFDLVGWRADQEELRRILEDAELRHWC